MSKDDPHHLFNRITHILFLLCCETQRSELLPVLSSPEEVRETLIKCKMVMQKTFICYICYFLTDLSCKFICFDLSILSSQKLIQPHPVSENVEMNYCHVSTE